MVIAGTSNSRLRWYAKKAARKALSLASWGSGTLSNGRERGRQPRLRALTYHRFGEIARDPFCVASNDFERQMALLAQHGKSISLQQMADFLARGDNLLGDAAVVTIDDGFCSVYTHALPILRAFRIPAVLFITTNNVGRRDETTLYGEAYLSWDQIAKLSEAGVAIGSHAVTHRSLGRLNATEIEDEVARSREILTQRTGAAIEAFAYPYGTVADFNDTTQRILRESGYSFAFTSQHGAISTGANPFELPRVKVEGGESLWWFSLLARGGLDAWSWVDRNLWKLQANRHAD